jgi:hypothetical protein
MEFLPLRATSSLSENNHKNARRGYQDHPGDAASPNKPNTVLLSPLNPKH